MIVTDQRTSWARLLFTVRGSISVKIWRRVAVTTLVATAITVLHEKVHHIEQSLTVTPFSLIGLALSIFLGFRNNTSYDRFWEGRKLWGRLVNTSRSLTRQTLTLIRPPTDSAAEAVTAFQREFVYRLIAYVHMLRLHLRSSDALDDLSPFLPPEDIATLHDESNRPFAIAHGLGEMLSDAWKRGWIETYHLPILEQSLTDLVDIQGGCERIKATPIPFAYNLLMHRIVAVYCLFLPFGIVNVTHMLTPFVVLFVSYAFFGLDAIGDEIEEPFGLEPNDLPLDTLSRMIEVNLRQRLGETELPPLLTAKNGLLT